MRKILLAGVATLPLLLGACNTPTPATSTSTSSATNPTQVVNTVQTIGAQAAQDIQTLSAGMPAILSALRGVGTVTAAQVGQVSADVAKAQSAAQTLAGMPSVPVNDTTLQTFEAAVNDALAVANVALPGNPYVMAASVIAPLVGVVVNTVATQVQSVPVAAMVAMTPDQARAVLKAAVR